LSGRIPYGSWMTAFGMRADFTKGKQEKAVDSKKQEQNHYPLKIRGQSNG